MAIKMTMQASVPLAEVGLSPDEAQGRGYVVAPDWRGDPSITLDDAAAYRAERDAAVAEHEAAWATHRAETVQYEQQRLTAARDAGRCAYEDAVRRHETGPAAHAAQRAAYQHAGAQYERGHRRPRFNGTSVSTSLLFVDEREEGSLVAAVVGKLRGPTRPRTTEMEVAR